MLVVRVYCYNKGLIYTISYFYLFLFFFFLPCIAKLMSYAHHFCLLQAMRLHGQVRVAILRLI